MTKEQIERCIQEIQQAANTQELNQDKWKVGINPYSTDEEWDLWAKNWGRWNPTNPPPDAVPPEKVRCEKHEWVDTGTSKTWCKRCDKSGRWEMGVVHEIDS